MMESAVFATSYLPSVSYFSRLLKYGNILIEVCENYPKQTFRNRCRISTANGVQTLTVPVEKPSTLKCLTRDIRISEHGAWRRLHWNTLVSAYNLSPFFEFFADDFRPFYEKKYNFLVDYNTELLLLIAQMLDIKLNISQTSVFSPVYNNDFREALTSRKAITDLPLKPYYQVFKHKNGFMENMSVVDLLFNMGQEALLFL